MKLLVHLKESVTKESQFPSVTFDLLVLVYEKVVQRAEDGRDLRIDCSAYACHISTGSVTVKVYSLPVIEADGEMLPSFELRPMATSADLI